MIGGRFQAALAGAAILAAVTGGCGGGQTNPKLFSSEWSDDGGRSIEAVRQRLGAARPAPGADVVVAVAGSADKIIGQPLAGGAKWTFAHVLDARPLVTGTVVIGSGKGELFALDALKGTKLWARPTGGLVVHGAGDDGSVSVITMSQSTGTGSVLLAVLHDGTVVRQVETDKVLGTPAVLSRIAFVPWGNQYVTALDLSDGDEAGRVVVREKVSRAWTEGGSLYFGEVGMTRFDTRIKDASQNRATHIALPTRELPGTPALMTSGTDRQPVLAGAQDRIRLYARPTSGDGPLGIEGDRYFATYFRLVMGFEATKGALGWVHLHPADIIGGDTANGNLVVCDETGKITVMDARSGGIISEQSLGEPVKSCVVQVEAWRAAGGARALQPLAGQIAEALASHQAQLAMADRLLLRELTTMPDELATKTLVELASEPRVSPVIVADARLGLASRRNGAKYMIEALDRHYDYLKDVLRPPPVSPIAQALAAMNEKTAAPALASHLLDPSATDEDVKQAAAALQKIGTAKELAAMKEFFGLYRAAAESDDISAAVVSIGESILRLGGKDGRAMIDQALADPMTSPFAKARLESVVQAVDAEKTEKGAATTTPKTPSSDSKAGPPEFAPPSKK